MPAFSIIFFLLIRVINAQFAFTAPTSDSVVVAGSGFTIAWSTNNVTSSVSLLLLEGSSTSLSTAATIAVGIPNSGSYTWTPDASLATGTEYTIGIGIGSFADASKLTNTNYSQVKI